MTEPTAGFLPYQWELRNEIAAGNVVVVEKSRRTGYSWAAAAVAVEHAAKRKADGGMDVYYMGYNLDMAREFVEYCGDWGKLFIQGAVEVGETLFRDPDNPDKDIKAFRVEFDAGKVVALPSMPRALRGMQGLVILDEAAFHDDLKELLKAAFALLIWGGKVLVISTHDGDDNPFNTLCMDVRSGRRPYKLLTCDFDRALREGLYQRICHRQGIDWSAEAEAVWREGIIESYGDGADEELFCIPARGTGSYIPAALLEARAEVAPVVRLTMPDEFTHRPEEERIRTIDAWCRAELLPLLESLPQDLPHAFGEDFGRSGDLSSIWPVTIERNLRRRCPFLVELRNIPFEQQRQILFFIVDRLPRFLAGALDATGNGAYLAEVAAQRYGAGRIREVKLNNPWYAENMPPFKAAFEDGMTMVPADPDVIMDHRAIKVVKGVPKVPRDERTGTGSTKRHGDTAIAHVLAYTASRQDAAPIEIITESTAGVSGGSIFGPARAPDDLSMDMQPMDWSLFNG